MSRFGNSSCPSQRRSHKAAPSPTTGARRDPGLLALRGPYRSLRGRVPALVALEVESHGRRDVRREWRRNDAKRRNLPRLDSNGAAV